MKIILKIYINSPFYPISRDSEGDVVDSFIWLMNMEKEWLVVFNWSYTPLYLYFTKKDNVDINRYYENIISGNARQEIHLIKDYRQKKVNYNIDYNNK